MKILTESVECKSESQLSHASNTNNDEYIKFAYKVYIGQLMLVQAYNSQIRQTMRLCIVIPYSNISIDSIQCILNHQIMHCVLLSGR